MLKSRKLCTAASLLAALSATAIAHAQLVAFDVTGVNAGCETGATVVDPNISAQSLCRGPGVTAGTVTNGYTGTSWNEASEAAAVTVGDYFTATITVNGGFEANITSAVAVVRRSNTGPLNIAVRTSADNFATTVATATLVNNNSDQTFTFDFPDILGATGTPEIRIYAWGASAGTGTFRLTDTTSGTPSLTINGTTQPGGGGPTTGACCFANGSCQILTAANCATQGGTYSSDNTPCASANCPQPTGACCISGTCQGVFTEVNCNSFSGVWGGAGTDCGTFVCPAPNGACCVGTTCSIATQAICTLQGGVWTLDGECTPNPCSGACCVGSTCSIQSPTDCATQGGTFIGVGTTCNAGTCPSSGACCVGTTCTVSTYAACASNNGTWLGRNVACGANTCVRPTLPATVVGMDDFDLQRDSAPLILRRVSDGASIPAPINGQYFGIAQRFRAAPENLPFGVLDDSLSILPSDNQGIVSENKVDGWFAAVNMYAEMAGDANPDTDPTQIGEDELEVLWSFNVTGRTNLSVSIDMAAMGDFEAITCSGSPACVVDRYTFAASIDGGAFTDVFTVRADEAIAATYTMAGGNTVTADDPMKVDGTTLLTNAFATFSKSIAGTGSTLTLRLRAQSDGGTEAFAFDNIVIMANAGGNPTPCQLADFNDSGSVTADDIFAFLDAWFAQNGSTGPGFSADINANDSVTADDIFAFLDLWFAQNGQSCN